MSDLPLALPLLVFVAELCVVTIGKVQLVFTIVKRKEIDKVLRLIEEFDPQAFYAIDEVETVNRGIFPLERLRPRGLARFGLLFGKVHSASASCGPEAQERAAA